MRDLITSHDLTIPGLTIGHGTDLHGKTGVTVLLCPEGATAAAEVRGTATGSRQFDSLRRSHHVASKAHAIVLAGGSGYGLSAADGVVSWLEERGYGFDTGVRMVPLVPTAILFDLAFGDSQAAPTQEQVAEALASASAGPQPSGSIGAGTEEVLLGLCHQVFACGRIGQIQAIFVDQHFLMLEPALPRDLRHVFVNAFAQFPRKWRKIEPLGFPVQLHALNHSAHS